ncbi:MAG: exo-alpha-sialidase [Candidatus Hydrogenedentes bacterium]|nr:exo-alpha-sialidase [Candidatus Hydrogenedentota bacterium]
MFPSIFIACCVALAAPQYEAQTLFPAEPFHNHGSSIVETPEGDLLACWFHGSGERKSDDVQVLGARKRKGDAAWSAPFTMADTPDLPDCNPVLFVDPRGKLWLFWIAVQDNEWGGSLLKYRVASSYAKDGPPEWEWQDVIHCRPTDLDPLFFNALTEAETLYADALKSNEGLKRDIEAIKVRGKEKLVQRLGWMTRLHPIMLSDTRMMLGLYSDVFNCSLAAFTDDWGKTWQFSRPIVSAELGNIQPSFVRKKNGDVIAFMRDNGFPNQIRRAVSNDGGMSWGPIEKMEIPNPGSSVECIALASGNWALVCNDTKNGRHLLTVYLSDDEGATWTWSRRLENFEREKGSGSYPSLIQSKDGALHCTYSFVRQGVDGSTIKHAEFNEEWIKEGK